MKEKKATKRAYRPKPLCQCGKPVKKRGNVQCPDCGRARSAAYDFDPNH